MARRYRDNTRAALVTEFKQCACSSVIEHSADNREVRSLNLCMRTKFNASVCRLASNQEKANGYMGVRIFSGVPIYIQRAAKPTLRLSEALTLVSKSQLGRRKKGGEIFKQID